MTIRYAQGDRNAEIVQQPQRVNNHTQSTTES
jgi:hypothetical protein